jgi:3'-phosphoadenosine 5'-phosphosulfate (PAPS) 3'-phosphatase
MTDGPPRVLRDLIRELHRAIRSEIQQRVTEFSGDFLSQVGATGHGDVSLNIDLPAERLIHTAFAACPMPVVVTCEGLGRISFGANHGGVPWHVLIDPLDGSREIAFGKRSAWVLTGIAAAQEPTLADICWALQTEVPPPHQTLAVEVEAVRGRGASERVWDVSQSAVRGPARKVNASSASSIRGGFALLIDYFAGTHALTGILADRIFARVVGDPRRGEAAVYNDQYLTTAGVLYLLASGRYRFVGDLRPQVNEALARVGAEGPLCAHPYDLAAGLIAEESGAVLTDGTGRPLSYPFDTTTDCSFLGFANPAIAAEVRPALESELERLDALTVQIRAALQYT